VSGAIPHFATEPFAHEPLSPKVVYENTMVLSLKFQNGGDYAVEGLLSDPTQYLENRPKVKTKSMTLFLSSCPSIIHGGTQKNYSSFFIKKFYHGKGKDLEFPRRGREGVRGNRRFTLKK
jgi:hypothetical protein